MADGPIPNPNPSRITDASWRFMQALLAMEPDTENSGIYANKPGYHGTRAENEARDRKDGRIDYSRRDPLDLLGPDDKAAAYDWTHRAAQRGDYRSMAKYGNRLRAAFDARDPRLNGWAEAQGQTDLDATPEELNFGPSWTTGTPSSSHAWHWHLSERRAYAPSWTNKQAMLSILRGESLADYLARGGQLITSEGDNDMSELAEQQIADLWHALIPDPPKRTQGSWTSTGEDGRSRPINPLYDAIDRVSEKVETVAAPELSDEQLAKLADMVAAKLALAVTGLRTGIEADTRDAVADLAEGGAAAVRADTP